MTIRVRFRRDHRRGGAGQTTAGVFSTQLYQERSSEHFMLVKRRLPVLLDR